MPRKYRLKCPVARTLDIIGDRWTHLDFGRFVPPPNATVPGFRDHPSGPDTECFVGSIEGSGIQLDHFEP
jgi:hypothetical protein